MAVQAGRFLRPGPAQLCGSFPARSCRSGDDGIFTVTVAGGVAFTLRTYGGDISRSRSATRLNQHDPQGQAVRTDLPVVPDQRSGLLGSASPGVAVDEWPGRWGIDAGIDLVAEDVDGQLWAIQAKAYGPSYRVTKKDVNRFLAEAGADIRLQVVDRDDESDRQDRRTHDPEPGGDRQLREPRRTRAC